MKEDWKKEAKPFMEGLLVGRKEREAEIIEIIDNIINTLDYGFDVNSGEYKFADRLEELKKQIKEKKEQW